MAQTDQAWDWGVELRDEERSELERLRGTVARLRTQLEDVPLPVELRDGGPGVTVRRSRR
jgi:hypothetical protein